MRASINERLTKEDTERKPQNNKMQMRLSRCGRLGRKSYNRS